MTSIETIREFLETWAKRRTGELPLVDLRVACSSCGRQIIGDARVEFGREGLLCQDCFRKAR